ncbi:NADH dehydrogenase [ubiquinone] complex I assembly factor [Fasciola hepatica]|uniref:Protein arginine methyltransferase NDUFAF7 n=1 Tax=Fasciola hepatica TaxID=6192 RepID=A0A4E0RI66_FASHE|nr:NADH dehydrogenase [ubiquinone] complex I assembly factor [Fasciola hepatica]
MKKDVFGSHGDFITSPEISQVFGELLGIWLTNEWISQNSPSPFRLAELGPGRGTLLSDILRVFSRFPSLYESVSIHLVEVSPVMRSIQTEMIQVAASRFGRDPPPVSWHENFEDIPTGIPTFVLAHEFFDALPVHQFRKTKDDWREVLLSVTDNSVNEERRFCLVNSPTRSVAQAAYLPLVGDLTDRDCVEIAPRALNLVDQICRRIQNDKGAALIVDYGHLGEKGVTLRGFRNHQVCDPLEDPGDIDLTCDVDFSLFSRYIATSDFDVEVHGPEPQAYFLINMGILNRLQALITSCPSKEQQDELFSGCEMLITTEQMGERFKFMAIVPRGKKRRMLPGFTELPGTPYSKGKEMDHH